MTRISKVALADAPCLTGPKTMEEQYKMVVEITMSAYEKLGWDHKQSPMIFQFHDDGRMTAYLITSIGKGEDIRDLHRKLASETYSAVLTMEAWQVVEDKSSGTSMRERFDKLQREQAGTFVQPSNTALTNEQDGLEITNDPRREEIISVNIRQGTDRKIGVIQLDRGRHRITAGDLFDPRQVVWRTTAGKTSS